MLVSKPTTVDNPFDPFDCEEEWRCYDENVLHYCTNQRLAMLAHTSPNLSPADNNLQNEIAISRLIDLFPGIYERISRDL